MERSKDFGKDNSDMPHIPHELTVQDILTRLPIKTIFKFRSVCKLWRLLPYDREFIDSQLNRSVSSPHAIVLSLKTDNGYRCILSFHSLDIAENGQNTKLMSTMSLPWGMYEMKPSCEGLICFSCSIGQEVFVCNPSTHEFIQIPKIHFKPAGIFSSCMVAGFGLDPVTRQYKVLCVSQSLRDGHMKCFIFTLGSADAKWRQLDDIPFRIQTKRSAYLNGAAHWVIDDRNHFTENGILSFRFHDEKYEVLPLTNCKIRRPDMLFAALRPSVILKVLGGYLHLITTWEESEADHCTFDFYALKDYTNHVWTHEVSVRIGIIFTCEEFSPPIPVDIKNGEILFSFGKKLYSQKLKEEESSKIPCEPSEITCDFSDDDELVFCRMYQPNHVESLVSLNGKAMVVSDWFP